MINKPKCNLHQDKVVLLAKNVEVKMPIVPRFVGEFIEHCKGKDYAIFALWSEEWSLVDLEHYHQAINWARYSRDNANAIAQAYLLDDWIVEEQEFYQLYLEIMPDHIAESKRWLNYSVEDDSYYLSSQTHMEGLAHTIFSEEELEEIDHQHFKKVKMNVEVIKEN